VAGGSRTPSRARSCSRIRCPATTPVLSSSRRVTWCCSPARDASRRWAPASGMQVPESGAGRRALDARPATGKL